MALLRVVLAVLAILAAAASTTSAARPTLKAAEPSKVASAADVLRSLSATALDVSGRRKLAEDIFDPSPLDEADADYYEDEAAGLEFLEEVDEFEVLQEKFIVVGDETYGGGDEPDDGIFISEEVVGVIVRLLTAILGVSVPIDDNNNHYLTDP